MSLIDQARQDMRDIINGEFSTELTITPTGLSAVVVKGLATRHSQGFDSDGLPVIADNAHCSFSELDLNDLGVTTRNANKDVIIKDWQVDFADAIGTYSYSIKEPIPDNTLGLIRCTLTKK